MPEFLILMLPLASLALGVYYATCYLVDGKQLEGQVKQAFNEKKYQEVAALVEKKHRRFLPHSVSLAAARSYAALSRNTEALQFYQEILSRMETGNPQRPEVLAETGVLYYKDNKIQKAEEVFHEVLTLQPWHAQVNYRLAELLFHTGRAQESLAILTRMMTEFSREMQAIQDDVRFLFAEVLSFLGMYQQALVQYDILDKAGKKHNTPLHARAHKEMQRYDRAIPMYNRLIRARSEQPSRQIELIFECADAYRLSESLRDGLLFVEEFIPKAEGRDQALLQLHRARFLEALGDDFLALQEYAVLQGALPDEPEIKEKVALWGFVLDHAYLKRYYTSDTAVFEKFIAPLIPAGAAVTRRNREYYICTQGIKAFVFYRRYTPLTESVMQNIDLAYSSSCFRAAVIEFLSLSGAEEGVPLARKDYTAIVTSGDAFLRRLSVGQQPGYSSLPRGEML